VKRRIARNALIAINANAGAYRLNRAVPRRVSCPRPAAIGENPEEMQQRCGEDQDEGITRDLEPASWRNALAEAGAVGEQVGEDRCIGREQRARACRGAA
jgi:hypothetical protein